jgi:hypothetical protein
MFKIAPLQASPASAVAQPPTRTLVSSLSGDGEIMLREREKIETEMSPKTIQLETEESFQALKISRAQSFWSSCFGSGSPKLNDGSLGTTMKYLVKAHRQYKVLTILITAAVIFDVWAVEERWSNGNKSTWKVDTLKCCGSLMTFCGLCMVARYYNFMNK